MRGTIYFILILLFFLSACTPSIVPVVTKNVTLKTDGSHVYDDNDVAVSISDMNLDYAPSFKEMNLLTFSLFINNKGSNDYSLSSNDIYVSDNNNSIYHPEDLMKYDNSPNSYLIPYPYVGYYYLQDSFNSEFRNSNEVTGSRFSDLNLSSIKKTQFNYGIIKSKDNSFGTLCFSIDPYVVTSMDLIINLTSANGINKQIVFKYLTKK